jgi:GntR family transcriptional regulator, transcriptional repressor for pyruvate dehydrogenase complex
MGDAESAGADEEAIVAGLRRRVAQAGRLPGERALAGELGVTRHRLRGALARLRAEGVVVAPGRSRNGRMRRDETMVRDTNPIEVIELRMVLEPALARLAALRASPVDIARIRRAATTWGEEDAGATDRAFHSAVAAGARNGLAADFYALLRKVGTDTRLALHATRPLCPKRVQQRDTEHRAIAEAIARRDPDGAEQAMRAHLAAVQRQILERLAPGMTAA